MSGALRRSGVLLGLAAALAVAGCGYSMRGNLPGDIKTVAVPIFKNLTQEPAVENILTAAVVTAFSNGGRLRVVPLEQADSVLEGEIVGYAVDSIAFDRNINVREYRLRVVVNVQFRDLRRHELLWKQDRLEERSDFRIGGQVSESISFEEGAARVAAVDIGRKIVALAIDRF